MLRRHPYIVSIIIATMLAIVVWALVPKEYAATTKVSDEYKETDLAIGMDNLAAKIKKSLGDQNNGINDIEVYSKALKTEDFARCISQKQVPGKKMTYGQWVMEGHHLWQSEDTIDLVSGNIEYNISTKQQTLTIQFTDRDPLVASQMLDSVTTHLQEIVTGLRHQAAEAALKNAEKDCHLATTEYQKASDKYTSYSDSHFDPHLETVSQQGKNFEEEAQNAYQYYKKTSIEYARQKALLERNYCSFAVVQPNVVPVSDTSHLYIYIISFVSLSILFLYISRNIENHYNNEDNFIYFNLFSPWILSIAVWIVNLLLHLVQSDYVYPIKQSAWYCLALWLPLLVITSFFMFCAVYRKPMDIERHEESNVLNIKLFHILWLISMILSPLFLRTVLKVVTQFDTADMLMNMRYLAVNGSVTSLVLNSVQGINVALFIFIIWNFKRISKIQFICLIVAYLLVEFALMEKSGVLVMLLSVLFVLYQKHKIRIRTIALSVIGIIVLFFFINMSKETSYSGTMTFIDFFAIYVTTPIVAFGQLMQDVSGVVGENTFGQLFQYLNAFGCHLEYTDRLQEFVYVPVPTNVYTIMQPFYEDFGYLGVAYFAIIYGALFGFVYGTYRNGNFTSCCIYTYLVEVIMIQFYNENLLQNLFMSVGFTIWIILLTQNKIKFDFEGHIAK